MRATSEGSSKLVFRGLVGGMAPQGMGGRASRPAKVHAHQTPAAPEFTVDLSGPQIRCVSDAIDHAGTYYRFDLRLGDGLEVTLDAVPRPEGLEVDAAVAAEPERLSTFALPISAEDFQGFESQSVWLVLETGRGECVQLQGALNGNSFGYPIFRGIDLRGADLSGAQLNFASLHQARLEGARLDGFEFGYAVVDGTIDAHTELPSQSFCEAPISNEQYRCMQ